MAGEHRRAFDDPVESDFYADAVAAFLKRIRGELPGPLVVREFGTGSARAVCEKFPAFPPDTVIEGYEIDADSYGTARRNIARAGLAARYHVRHADFFTQVGPRGVRDFVVANPPYLPLRNASPSFPELSGGPSGNGISARIIGAGFEQVMLIVSSYSDPLATLRRARRLGYAMIGWRFMPVGYGVYSRRREVQRGIAELRQASRAFTHHDSYLLIAAEWRRAAPAEADCSAELTELLHAFRSRGLEGDFLDRPFGEIGSAL